MSASTACHHISFKMENYFSKLFLVTCLFLVLEATKGLNHGRGLFAEHATTLNNGENPFRRRRLLQDETTESAVTTAAAPQEKDILTKITEFYADKNNMAMFCVLPVMVLIYGGCCVIYCVAKCRRYIRRKTHRPHSPDDTVHLSNDDHNDLSRNEFMNIPPNITETPKSFMPRHFQEPVAPHNQQQNILLATAPSVSHDQSPLPWLTSQEPMVPPIASYPPHNSRDTSSRQNYHSDEKRRDYRDLLRIKPAYVNDGFVDQDRPRIREAHSLKSPSEADAKSSNVDSGRESVMSYKEELLARYDALASLSMAKKAATILKSGNNENKQRSDTDIFNKKSKQKMVFIAE